MLLNADKLVRDTMLMAIVYYGVSWNSFNYAMRKNKLWAQGTLDPASVVIETILIKRGRSARVRVFHSIRTDRAQLYDFLVAVSLR